MQCTPSFLIPTACNGCGRAVSLAVAPLCPVVYRRDNGEGESQDHDRPGFVSRIPGLSIALAGNSSVARDDGSEGDGSRSASAEGVMVAHIHEGLSLNAEPVISGKRKR